MTGIMTSTFGGGSIQPLVLTLNNVASPNIPNLLAAAGWAGNVQPVIIEVTGPVNTLRIPASLTGWDATLHINKSASITGVAGSGGSPQGGVALSVSAPLKIDNEGSINGGGGRGGNGVASYAQFHPPMFASLTVTSLGGTGYPGSGYATSNSMTGSPAPGGSAGLVTRYGTYTGPTFGGPYDPGPCGVTVLGGNGGQGGGYGQGGGNGGMPGPPSFPGSGWSDPNVSKDNITFSWSSQTPLGGGSGGNSVTGNRFITWIRTGTRNGPISS